MGNVELSQEEIDYYHFLHRTRRGAREPRWRGTHVVKFPTDLILYAQVIFKRTPKFIIETGTRYGGSAQFFGDMLTLTGGTRVFSIDIGDKKPPAHPKVEYLVGSSTDPSIVNYIREQVGDGSVMASLDSDHRAHHVQEELNAYKDIVTPDQYMVVEDCWTWRKEPFWPYKAVQEFLRKNKNYKRFNIEKQFKFAVTKDGWLHRLR